MWSVEAVVNSENMRRIAFLPHEVCVVLYVTPTRILGLKTYNKTGTAVGVDMPEIKSMTDGCKAFGTNEIILVHNHPYFNGACDSSPSLDDLVATNALVAELRQSGIVLMDHIIASPEGCFSFRVNELL